LDHTLLCTQAQVGTGVPAIVDPAPLPELLLLLLLHMAA
jgi:hypothetical protein